MENVVFNVTEKVTFPGLSNVPADPQVPFTAPRSNPDLAFADQTRALLLRPQVTYSGTYHSHRFLFSDAAMEREPCSVPSDVLSLRCMTMFSANLLRDVSHRCLPLYCSIMQTSICFNYLTSLANVEPTETKPKVGT